jgi:RHS repeat-associated protein
VAYDGNGNVTALVNVLDGTLLANYDYGPFGEVIRATGPMAKNNPLRFSTKYQDDESDLLYYGYRYYKPSTGTWPNRDPLGESAFFSSYSKNLDPDAIDQLALCALQPTYCFVGNNSINKIDYLGNVIVDGSTHTIYVFN